MPSAASCARVGTPASQCWVTQNNGGVQPPCDDDVLVRNVMYGGNDKSLVYKKDASGSFYHQPYSGGILLHCGRNMTIAHNTIDNIDHWALHVDASDIYVAPIENLRFADNIVSTDGELVYVLGPGLDTTQLHFQRNLIYKATLTDRVAKLLWISGAMVDWPTFVASSGADVTDVYSATSPGYAARFRWAGDPDAAAELDDARGAVQRAMDALNPAVPYADNLAKQVATMLKDTVPVFWGAEATAAVAQRWKGQINENAKAPAYWGVLPELNHNEICGFEGMGAFGPLSRLVLLRDPRHHRQVERRFDLTRDLVAEHTGGVIELAAEGDTALARVMDLVMLGDYASLYLGLLRGVDPGPVEMIGKLKGRLADTGYGRAQGPA